MSDDSLKEFPIDRISDTSTANEDRTVPSDVAEASGISQRTFEDNNQKMNAIFEWIEAKLGILKIIQGDDKEEENVAHENEEDPTEANNAALEEVLEEIQEITAKDGAESAKCITEDVSKLLDMLQETTVELLDNMNKLGKRYRSVKILVLLIQHLSASVGSKVTLEDVQKHINGERVLELYSENQDSRELLFAKMETIKKYIDHGVKNTQIIARRTENYRHQVDVFFSEYSTSSDVQDVNDKLKELTKESENFLIQYSDSIGYLTTKAKNFFTVKKDLERPLSTFMTKEIPDFYKKRV